MMMTTQVALTSCQDYEEAAVETSVRNLLDLLGGIGAFVHPGDSVLIKPNLLAPKPSGSAVNTHPAVVRAVLKQVLKAGGRPVIGDSPGLGSAKKNAVRCGIDKIARDLEVPIIEFRKSVLVGKAGKSGFPLELAEEALNANVIINLPKLKTHGQVLMTLGVKNMFGCVIGIRKAQWHLKAGVNRDAFAKMLVEIYTTLSPALTLMDGIVGMEGNGPGSGTPRPIGLLAASADAVALDAVIMHLMGMDPLRLPTLRSAKKLGVGEVSLNRIEILGEKAGKIGIRDFKWPESADLEWRIPDFVMKMLKKSLSAYPESDPTLCKQCEVCVKACPQQVIKIEGDHLRIDTRRCIRCFCCQELCPHGAMKTRQGWLLKRIKKRSL